MHLIPLTKCFKKLGKIKKKTHEGIVGKKINYQRMNYTITAFLIAISIKLRKRNAGMREREIKESDSSKAVKVFAD